MTEAERFAQLRRDKGQDIEDAYNRFKANAPTIIIKIRNLLDGNVKPPTDTLNRLTISEVMNAQYSDSGKCQAAQAVAQFLKQGKIAEACKHYIDLVGDDDIEEAKSYVNSVYEMITFKNQSDFESMAKELVELKVLDKDDNAALEFANYSACDIETARKVIELL